MKSAIFSVSSDCYQVSNIAYVGPVYEIPQDRQKGNTTHYFRIITVAGTSFCHFNDHDSAVKARGALSAMMESLKPELFRNGRECLDPKRVVSYSRTRKLKNTDDGMTHGFMVSLETVSDKSNQIWFTYRTEESADKARRALYGKIQAVNNVKRDDEKGAEGTKDASLITTSELPF